MTETQRRIRAYKRALPHMKERVIAVALLLAMSISMMGSATFAWITLSASPEVSSLATTIVANGNLEIALSSPQGVTKKPDETKVGDGGQDITKSNLTWGNLVNLSHESYGLDYITLRPAQLNKLNLMVSPVQAVSYGSDGRITGNVSDFRFSNFTPNKVYEVLSVPEYGVRGVSSVTYQDVQGEQWLIDQLDVINNAYTTAVANFEMIYNTKKYASAEQYMKAVSYFIGLHVDVYLNGADPVCENDRVTELVDMMNQFKLTVESIGQVIIEIANLYQMQSVTDLSQYEEYDLDDLTSGKLDQYANRITALNYFTKALEANGNLSLWDKTTRAWNAVCNPDNTNSAYSRLQTNKQIKWKGDMETPLTYMCDVSTATLGGFTVDELQEKATNMDFGLLALLKDGVEAKINGGAIKDVDQLLLSDNQKMYVPYSDNIKIHVSYSFINTDVKPSICTGAAAPYLLPTDIKTADTAAGGGTNMKGTPVAAETYAMAVDMWVRTNEPGALLILEGELETVQEPLLDGAGNQIVDEEGKIVYQTKYVGYSGVNRVWTEEEIAANPNVEALPTGSVSATQGSGSCYVFYPASEEDEKQSLRLLRSMRVAFVDETGALLATAIMDTDHPIKDAGRVIVPLMLQDNEKPVELADGTTVTKYITPLVQNEAQWITALIYLDGTNLTNSEVLAAGSIKGQLNIQYGTSAKAMDAMDDADVMGNYYLIDVVSSLQNAFDKANKDNKITLRVSITGTTPSKVTGNFVSFISSTQGAKQDEFTMTLNSTTGYWEAEVSFPKSGNFQLRSLQLDGVDYMLDETEFVYVTVPGMSVSKLEWDVTNTNILTASPYFITNLTLELGNDENRIPEVRGVFIGEKNGSNVAVSFKSEDGEHYTATATFTVSDDYTLSSIYVDGNPVPIVGMEKSLSVQLGLRAQVRLSEPVLEGGPDETILKDVTFNASSGWSFTYTMDKPMTFDITCDIYDDQNNLITGKTDVVLNYSNGSVKDALSADLTWVPPATENQQGHYEGVFTFQHSGVLKFQDVVIDGKNPVTVADYAPTITSIPPNPMSYVNQSAYEPYVYDLSMTAENRVLELQLMNATAASLEVTLTKVDRNGQTVMDDKGKPVTETKTVTATSTMEDPVTGMPVSTFRVQTSTDGGWKITGLTATNVYYEGTFYAEGVGTVDLTEQVKKDEIGTYFITEAYAQVNNVPSVAMSSNFMEDNKLNNLTVSVLDYENTPLATVFRDLGIDKEITGTLTYTWNGQSGYTITSGTPSAALQVVGGALTADSNGVLSAGELNFKLAGTYSPTLTVTIGSGDDTVTYGKDSTDMTFRDSTNRSINLSWTAPDVTITGVDPAVGTECTTSASRTTKKNIPQYSSYSCEVYSNCTWTKYIFNYRITNCTVAQVQLTLANAGAASVGYVYVPSVSSNDYMRTYEFTPGNPAAWQSIGEAHWQGIDVNFFKQGDQTIETIDLLYEGVTYKLNLKSELRIKNVE